MITESDARQVWTVAIIILCAGALGGFTAYLSDRSQRRPLSDQPGWLDVLRYIALGVSASICVPLFLTLVQSALITKIFDFSREKEAATVPYADLLTLTGICLLAAISARRFLDTLSDKVLREVSRLERTAETIERKASKAEIKASKAEDRAEQSLELQDERSAAPRADADVLTDVQAPLAIQTDSSNMNLSSDELKALKSLMHLSFRTATGIGKDVGIPRSEVGELLDSLAEKKLVERTTSPTTGGPRWKISSVGVQVLRRAV